MPRALVIGSPIGHSRSPVIHEAGYRAAGLTDWSYDRAEVTADEVPEFLAGLDSDVRGLSVTMPCKEAALAAAATATPLATGVRAANTLVRTDDGWHADNTDVAGVVGDLRGAGCEGTQHAVVLGSGATARAVIAALAELGVSDVTFVVRTTARPETLALADKLGIDAQVVRQDADEVPALVGRCLPVVSTLPQGGADVVADRLVDAPSLRIGPAAGPYVLDVVYADWPTRLAQVMQERGATVVNGLDMLVHQAAAQFELFTATPAPIADMMQAASDAVK